VEVPAAFWVGSSVSVLVVRVATSVLLHPSGGAAGSYRPATVLRVCRVGVTGVVTYRHSAIPL
jgi:hypothetical protein